MDKNSKYYNERLEIESNSSLDNIKNSTNNLKIKLQKLIQLLTDNDERKKYDDKFIELQQKEIQYEKQKEDEELNQCKDDYINGKPVGVFMEIKLIQGGLISKEQYIKRHTKDSRYYIDNYDEIKNRK